MWKITSLLIIPFLFFNNSTAQTNFTKSLFYNLPVDQNKSKIIERIKSDTNLFQSSVSRLLGESFQVFVKQNSKCFPSTTSSPVIDIYETKYYVDSLYKYSTSTISLVLEYESSLGLKWKARNTFLSLAKQLEPDYTSFNDINNYFESDCEIRSKGKKREFYNTLNKEPTCIVEYFRRNNIKVWCVCVTYNLK